MKSLLARLAPLAFALSALLAQDPALLPLEAQALEARAAGDEEAATSLLLQAAAGLATPAAAKDTMIAARIEALTTEAARSAPTTSIPDLLAKLDALRSSLSAAPLLADRVGISALSAAGSQAAGRAGERAAELGFVREYWLIGPFANERGSGYSTPLAPEQSLDLEAELPGKRRPERWRQLPLLPFQPVLRLERLVQPHEQTLAYAAVAVLAESDGDAVLELGSTGSVRAFVNGAEVFARDVERSFAFDQDAAPLRLRAGANLLLFKVCHQEGAEFRFAARLRGTDGAPLQHAKFSALPADLAAAAAAPHTEAAPAADVPLGGRSTWRIGEAKGADALRLAWLWSARASDRDDNDRRDRAAAAAAAVALPDLAEPRLLVAASHEPHGRSAADRDDNDRRRALEEALAKSPDHVLALVELGGLLLQRSGLAHEASALADRALLRRPLFPQALFLREAALRALGLEQLAAAEMQAHAGAENAPPELRRAVANVIDDREPQRALALRRSVFDATGDENDARALAALLARTGDVDASQAVLTQRVAADPYAIDTRLQLAQLQHARGDARSALSLLEAWLTINPDHTQAMLLAGRCWRTLRGQDPAAGEQQQTMLREVLAVEPNRRDEERYAEYLTAGEAGEASAYYTPFVVDAAALLAADAGAPADAIEAKDPLRWLLRQRVVRANGNGTTSTYQHDVVRILTEDGASMLQNYGLSYYRGEQRGRLLSCTLFRKDGSVEHPALRGAMVALPDLRPGDVVAAAGRVDDLQPSFFGDYFGYVHHFTANDGSPVQQSELVVLADPGRDYRWQSAHGAPEPERETRLDGSLQFRWRMSDLPRDVPEVRRPDRKELEPLVRMTTFRDWDQFAAWWWNLIKNQLEVSPAMRATVERVTAGLEDTDAKIAAIYHFVTTDVRYEAWEFGVHGYKPYSTAIIHERRHGDCKDKALLLCALLGEIGVACRPVLIFADPLRSEDDLTLAMVEQFNHCIAWMPPQAGRPAHFLDGTATWHPPDTTPEMDQGARVLVVDAGKADLQTIEWTTPERNRERTQLAIELLPDGGARLHLEERPTGNQAVNLRSMLATEPARRREVVEQGLVHRFGKLSVTSLDASDPAAAGADVFLTVEALVPDIGRRTADRWQLPSTWEADELQSLTTETERKAPLLLGVPHGGEVTLRYRTAPGWTMAQLPAQTRLETPFASFDMQWRKDGDDVVVERKLQFMVPRIAAVDHAALRDFVAAVKAADSQLVLLQKGER